MPNVEKTNNVLDEKEKSNDVTLEKISPKKKEISIPETKIVFDSKPENTLEKDSDSELNSSSDSESDEDYSDSESDEESDSLRSDSLDMVDNSELYVISIDDIPQFYVQSEELAKERMWDTARLVYLKLFGNFNAQFINIKDNELHITGKFRFFFFSYDSVLHRLKYHKIKECV